ncbi:transglycosylase SLT domain-containing protein [Roseomonas elaeocarpi]|uniref:Transglycosylase SLT domain-containing protein n=1 Tax=Roseomonas elaeocarpi TaxID=907779 RepID=A0ABV6JWT5_9PROT
MPKGRGAGSRLRGVAALSLLAALAACGSQPTATGPIVASTTSPYYHRPSSYDPPGPPSDPWGPYIRDASKRFDIPERWIREVMRQESGGRTTATSPVGAMGLMQVMPATYAELASRYGLGNDPYFPYDSIMAGTAYVREMYELYGTPGFLAAYNGGPRRLEDYLWGGKSLPAETRNYVARIGPRIAGTEPNRKAPPEVYAAAELPLNIPPGPRRGDTATMLALREQRRAVDPGVKVARLPAGPVIAMDPIPDGSTSPAPVQVASLGGGPVIAMAPIPDGSTSRSNSPQGTVVAMDPIPDGSTSRANRPQGTVIAMDPIPDGSTSPAPSAAAPRGEVIAMDPIPDGSTSPRAEPRPEPARTELAAALPTPPSFLGSAHASERGLALPPPPAPVARGGDSRFAALDVPPPRSTTPRTLGFVGSASAATLPAAGNIRSATSSAGGGNWAVQVGAFASENLARSAAGTAQRQIGGMGTRVMVQPVMQGRNVLYRARVMGLSRDGAQGACERLRTQCMTLSPDAQS